MKNEELTKKFDGEWILLFNDEIVDHSKDVEEILKIAEEKFPVDRFPKDDIKISKVFSENTRLY